MILVTYKVLSKLNRLSWPVATSFYNFAICEGYSYCVFIHGVCALFNCAGDLQSLAGKTGF